MKNLNSLSSANDRKILRPRKATFDYRSLEIRRLLAGDVLFFQQGSFLRVVGDDQANVIEISQNEAGETVVTGVDTTVNGQSTPQAIQTDVAQNLSVALKSGDDDVMINNLTLSGIARLLGDEGNDRIVLDGFSSRYLHIDVHAGDDIIQLADTNIDKSTYVFGAEGSDVIAVESFMSGRNFKVYGGVGDDTFAAGDFEVGRKFRLNLDNGDDSALLAGQADVGRSTKIRTGDGDDFVGILPAQNDDSINFDGRVVIDNGSGDDDTALDDNVNLNGSNRINGGTGSDSIQLPTETNASSRGFESNTVDNLAELIDRVFSTLDQAGIESALFGSSSDVELNVSDTSLNFTEGDEAVPVDDGIEIVGPTGQQYSGATVSVNGFVAGQDVLSFDGLNGVSGQFDSSSGVLSLTGTEDAAAYQEALRNVWYENTSENPVVDERMLEFTLATDSEQVIASRPLEVIGVNDAPIIELSRDNVELGMAGALPVVIDDQLELSDVDSPTLNSAIVSITQGLQPGIDRLAFEAQAGVIGTFDPSTGALTFVGDASIETYETLLRSVTHESLGVADTRDRNIRFTVNDGELSGFDDLEGFYSASIDV